MNAKTFMVIGSIFIIISLIAPVATIGTDKVIIDDYTLEKSVASGAGFILLLIGISSKIQPGRRFSLVGSLIALFPLLVSGWIFVSIIYTNMLEGFFIEDVIHTASIGWSIPLCVIGSLIVLLAGIKKQVGTGVPSAIIKNISISNEYIPDFSDRYFSLKWGSLTAIGRIVAITIGALIATPLTKGIANFINQPTSSYTYVIINNSIWGLLIAFAIGVTQWLLLRKRLQGAVLWLTALIVGETLGLAFIASFIKFVGIYILRPGIIPLVTGSFIGLLVALVQGEILQNSGYPRKPWLIVIPVVWAFTHYFNPIEYFSLAGSPYLANSATTRTGLLTTGIFFMTIGALLQGVIEGVVITWILRQKTTSP